jgi:hypothetical protein
MTVSHNNLQLLRFAQIRLRYIETAVFFLATEHRGGNLYIGELYGKFWQLVGLQFTYKYCINLRDYLVLKALMGRDSESSGTY